MRKWILLNAASMLLFWSGSVHAECLFNEENDVRDRVVKKIEETFVEVCPKMARSSLDFKYFGVWSSEPDQLTAQQTFYVTGKQAGACVTRMVVRLRLDARHGVAPNCRPYKVFRAKWFPNADSGPSVLFYLKKN